jgi:hypothetical protein
MSSAATEEAWRAANAGHVSLAQAARTCSRMSSSMSRGTLRAIAVVHWDLFSFQAQRRAGLCHVSEGTLLIVAIGGV